MTTTTLQMIFGATASQDASYVYINKMDLPLLVTQQVNDAVALLAAIISQAQKNYEGLLCDDSGNVLSSPDGFALGYDLSTEFTDITVNFFDFYLPINKLAFCFFINFKKPYAAPIPQ